ncbi:MAG: hypothetical protein OEZ57_02975 [Nitrospirota bacterium]|nr:hypothetical protein [Nitrospirota bacterium]MDH5586112.1 hypothetical protein [Nitrospirota bacterium]MDH5773863.1 hypothetical protein [Nitrospirota bacterium]
MRLFSQKWGHVIFLGLVVCVLSGCQLTPYIRGVHEDEHLLVRLEDHTGGPFPENPMRFDHPVVRSEEQWERVLRTIQIREESGGNPAFKEDSAKPGKASEALFTDEEISFLTPVAAQAFARARSNEWVTFVIRHPLGSYEWLNKTIMAQSMTSGGFYVANQKLHLYLTNIRSPITSTIIGENIWDNPFYITDAMYYQVEDTATQTVKQHPQQGLRGKINPSINEVTLEMARSLEAHEDGSQSQPAEGEFPDIHSRTKPAIAKKLRDLLILRQDGLITQEDYDGIKRTLLEQFIDETHRVK